MAGKPQHDEQTRALVYYTLTVHDGNVKRTARETGVHENTIRRWKSEWAAGDKLPSQQVMDEIVAPAISKLEETRDLALDRLHEDLERGVLKGRDLTTAFGVLDDKLARAKGLATNRTEHVVALPSAEEIKGALLGLVIGAQAAASERHAEIIEAQVIEQPRRLPR